MPAPESILALARKLKALCDPKNNATEGERAAAFLKLRSLLDRHNLTDSDLTDATLHTYEIGFHREADRELLKNIIFFILDTSSFPCREWKAKKIRHVKVPGPNTAPNYFIRVQLTRIQHTDIQACYNHYAAVMVEAEHAIEETIRSAQTELKNLPTALAIKYKIYSTQRIESDERSTLSPDELAAILSAMNRCKADRWQKPTAMPPPEEESSYEDDWDACFTEEDLDAMNAEERDHKRKLTRAGLRLALTQRCKKENNYSLNRVERWFYTLKLFLCVDMGRHWHPNYGNYPDVVMPALIEHRKTYAGWEEDWIEVGHGVFRNWFYQLNHDSDWNM